MVAMVVDERIHETSLITGTGEYTLLGAATGKQPVSVIGANNYAPLFVEDGTNWEAGFYTYVTGPGRVQRTHVVASSNGDAAVNWNNATVNIRAGLPAWLAFPRVVTKSVAGSSDVTLTALEQRCHILILTGALTGAINVIVDDTAWKWSVYNNTSGSYALTVKTSAGTGKATTQGKRTDLQCDGTNVVYPSDDRGGLQLIAVADAAASATIDFTGLDSTYDEYRVVINSLYPATDSVALYCRFSQDGGSTWKSGASDYLFNSTYSKSGTAAVSNDYGTAALIGLTPASSAGNNQLYGLSGYFSLFNPSSSTQYRRLRGFFTTIDSSGNIWTIDVSGALILNATAINGIRLYMSSGNITSGKFYLFGVRKI